MSQYNDSEKQDERKEIHFIIDSIMSVVFILSSTLTEVLRDALW